jgi:C-methyltransferase
VRNDGTVLEHNGLTPQSPFWESFAEGSAAMSFPAAGVLDGLIGSWIDQRPKVRVLDIAAGSGIYGYSLLKHSNVDVTMLDWPNVLGHTREWATRLRADTKRVRYLEGDLFDIDYGGPYDLILLSQVYHHFDEARCGRLTAKAAAALAPGGRVAIQDWLNEGDNLGARMYSVVMLFWTHKGQAYSSADYGRWLEGAGFSAPAIHPSQGIPASWMIADKK